MTTPTPVGQLKELPFHKGYYLDEAQQLFTHWRVVIDENQKLKKLYIAKMISTEERVYVEPYASTYRGRTVTRYKVVRAHRWRTASRLEILTEGARGPKPIYLATQLDGDPKNFQPENLAWVKLAEHQRIAKGEIITRGKLTRRQIKKIQKRLADGYKPSDLAEEFGVSRSRISQLKKLPAL